MKNVLISVIIAFSLAIFTNASNTPFDVALGTYLEDSDFHGVLNMVKKNDVMAEHAVAVYKRRFSSKPILIKGPFESDLRDEVVVETDDYITIKNYSILKLAIEKFGSGIQTLLIDYVNIDSTQRDEIHAIIDENTSESLKTLKLSGIDENVWSAFKKPLPTIETLIIDGALKMKSSFLHSLFGRKTLKLNEIFPGLRHLTMNYMNVPDSNVLDVEFSQLERVDIAFVPAPFNRPQYAYFDHTIPAMEKLFKKNPQIHTLVMEHCNVLDYLRIASTLPNLRVMQVNFAKLFNNYLGPRFYFLNLKQLALKMKENIDLSAVADFDELEELVMICSGKKCNGFPVDSRIKKLFVDGYDFGRNGLEVISKKAKLLEDVFISSRGHIDADDVVEFVERSKYLKKFELENESEGIYDALEVKFSKGWSLSKDDDVIILEKIGLE